MRKVLQTWETGLIEVAKGCFAYIQSGGLNISNAGLIVGTDTSVVADTLYVRPMAEAFQKAIGDVTSKPIGEIVFTHHHVDHILGSNWFPKDIPVIGHKYMRERMIESELDLSHFRHVNPEYAEHLVGIDYRHPTVTYEGEMTLYPGDMDVELHHLGHSHSKGDTLVYVPSLKVLYTGDCSFNFVTPATFDANIGNWIQTARHILDTFPLTKVVPGHGPIGDRRVLEETLGYLELVQSEARKRFDKGIPADEAAMDIPLGEYSKWMKPDRVEQAVMKLYNEFRGEGDKVISLDAARGG